MIMNNNIVELNQKEIAGVAGGNNALIYWLAGEAALTLTLLYACLNRQRDNTTLYTIYPDYRQPDNSHSNYQPITTLNFTDRACCNPSS
jgi:hypothetical protein